MTDVAVPIKVWKSAAWTDRLQSWAEFAARLGPPGLVADPRWLSAICDGLRQEPFAIEATDGGRVVGLLLLSLVKSPWFGRFLVSLPYVNTAGVVAVDSSIAASLVDRAVKLADDLNVRYLELRHEVECPHPALTERLTSKVHMRLKLPASANELWKQLKPKVRNQVRKAEKQEFAIEWGGKELLAAFYEVFSLNMRDLGTPVFGRRLFSSILARFGSEAEFCIVRQGRRPIAGGLLLHGNGVTQVPSASSLRSFNSTCVNMLMYWRLLERAIARGQRVFDFGRSTIDSNTFQFKSQWVKNLSRPSGSTTSARVQSAACGRIGQLWCAVRVWRRLPVWLTRLIGPSIVAGSHKFAMAKPDSATKSDSVVSDSCNARLAGNE